MAAKLTKDEQISRLNLPHMCLSWSLAILLNSSMHLILFGVPDGRILNLLAKARTILLRLHTTDSANDLNGRI